MQMGDKSHTDGGQVSYRVGQRHVTGLISIEWGRDMSQRHEDSPYTDEGDTGLTRMGGEWVGFYRQYLEQL